MDYLRQEEQIALNLRKLYHERGFRHVRPSHFEEYGLYIDNKNFLDTENIITFMDIDGKLMALKPDVTLSLIKNLPPDPDPQRLYYTDDVYRLSREHQEYKVLHQIGVECIANATDDVNAEIITLALDSLAQISPHGVLNISHLGFVTGLLAEMALNTADQRALMDYLFAKNTWDMSQLLQTVSEDYRSRMLALTTLHGTLSETLDKAKTLVCNAAMSEAYDQLAACPCSPHLRLDFSLVNDLDYYNGLIFRGYLEGVSQVVLSGGRYDNLMKRMDKRSGAIGFAVTLNEVERVSPEPSADVPTISIALPKGRLGDKVYHLLDKAGYECPHFFDQNRKLIIEDTANHLRYFLVKPSDVAIYVERGAADLGIVGKDILLESEPDVYELLNLGLGKCRVCVAAPNDFNEDPEATLRVATKFVNIAKGYYASLSRDIEIIHLNGSIELAPILGLSDVIVDIVETGITLLENDMAVYQDILDISARLIANKASYQFKRSRIDTIRNDLKEVL